MAATGPEVTRDPVWWPAQPLAGTKTAALVGTLQGGRNLPKAQILHGQLADGGRGNIAGPHARSSSQNRCPAPVEHLSLRGMRTRGRGRLADPSVSGRPRALYSPVAVAQPWWLRLRKTVSFTLSWHWLH